MDIAQLVQAMQTLNAEDAFRPRLTLDQWRVIAPFLTRHEIRAGDLLIKQGDADRSMYMLAQGSLQVFVTGGPPGSSRIAILILDLVNDDESRIGTVFFLMSEDNITRQLALPWMSFGSDEASLAPEGVFLRSSPHPRAYGNVARLLGRYVREKKVISLSEAIRRLSSLPAKTLGLADRGSLEPGYAADVVVFDPAAVTDRATFENPHQYAVGVRHVFVNGIQVLANGEHTRARPGRIVRGPGWTPGR